MMLIPRGLVFTREDRGKEADTGAQVGTMFFTSRSESGRCDMLAHKMAAKHIVEEV